MMQNPVFQGQLLAVLFIKQPSEVGGKCCLDFSFDNFMLVALKMLHLFVL